MQKKENQRVKLTKQLIRQGLFSLLKVKELEQITISELCRVSEVNRTTFYNHYKSVEDVLKEVAINILDDLRSLSTDEIPAASSLETLEKICIYLKENASTLKILFKCNKDSDITPILDIFIRKYSNKVAKNNNLDEDGIKMMLAFLMNGIYHMLKLWLENDIDKSPKEVAIFIYKIFNKNSDIE